MHTKRRKIFQSQVLTVILFVKHCRMLCTVVEMFKVNLSEIWKKN